MTSPIALPYLLNNDFYRKLQQQIDEAFAPKPERQDEPLPWEEEDE